MHIKSKNDTIRIGHMSDIHWGCSINSPQILNKFFKANKENFDSLDVLILAGDLISHSQKQMDSLFKKIRTYSQVPIVCVFGNHDYWDKPKSSRSSTNTSYSSIKASQLKALKDNNIHHLREQGSVTIERDSNCNPIVLLGFDGWYGNANPQTNDKNWMASVWQTTPPDPFEFLISKAHTDYLAILDELVQYEGYIKMLVTHFPPMNFEGSRSAWWRAGHEGIMTLRNSMADNFEVVFMGHFHEFHDVVFEGCRFLTTGADYNKPVLRIYEY